jgi:hypothetical protein
MSHNSKLKQLNHFTQMSLGLGFHVLALSPTVLGFFESSLSLSLSLSWCLSKTRQRETELDESASARATEAHSKPHRDRAEEKGSENS